MATTIAGERRRNRRTGWGRRGQESQRCRATAAVGKYVAVTRPRHHAMATALLRARHPFLKPFSQRPEHLREPPLLSYALRSGRGDPGGHDAGTLDLPDHAGGLVALHEIGRAHV